MSGDVLGVTVNGERHAVAEGTTVADLVAARCLSPDGIAVACDRQVVPKSAWGGTVLHGGEQVEIVTAAAGG